MQNYHRPVLHFTPQKGWINDPNGLVYENGNYHLFAQHYPDDVQWGPMHWYHAVSKDLVHWQHLPIALAPDELGMIFSGSAVYDAENTSGFGSKEHPAIVAMYTSHGETEQQSLAWSVDFVHFHKYEDNPVIPNTALPDFRDPKILPNSQGGWTVVLAAGDRVVFYASQNLKDWEKTGEFYEGNHSAGVWECPDLFPLTINGQEKWVLLVSMSAEHENHGSRTQYFLGQFNGKTFVCDQPFSKPEWIDQGYDNYAGVTFHNTQQRILMGWGMNWAYSSHIPADTFKGNMTLARKLSLVETPLGGIRLAQTPIADGVFDSGTPCDGTLPGGLFRLHIKGSGAGTVTLSNRRGQELTLGVDEQNRLFTDRSRAGAVDFDEDFASDWYAKTLSPRWYEGDWEINLIFDYTICELFMDEGTLAVTQLVFPDGGYDRVTASPNLQLTVYAPV